MSKLIAVDDMEFAMCNCMSVCEGVCVCLSVYALLFMVCMIGFVDVSITCCCRCFPLLLSGNVFVATKKGCSSFSEEGWDTAIE